MTRQSFWQVLLCAFHFICDVWCSSCCVWLFTCFEFKPLSDSVIAQCLEVPNVSMLYDASCGRFVVGLCFYSRHLCWCCRYCFFVCHICLVLQRMLQRSWNRGIFPRSSLPPKISMRIRWRWIIQHQLAWQLHVFGSASGVSLSFDLTFFFRNRTQKYICTSFQGDFLQTNTYFFWTINPFTRCTMSA